MKSFAAVLVLVANSVSAQPTIAEIVVNSTSHNTLEVAVLAAPDAVLQLLNDPSQNLTLFAPDDEAFATVDGEYLNDLLTEPWSQHLVCLLSSHLLGSVVPSSAITGPLNATSVSGAELFFDNMGGVITVNGSPVTTPDIMASNGIVHSISNSPILPHCVADSIAAQGGANEELSTLISLVVDVGLADFLDTERPITLLAPLNSAFAEVAPEILSYLSSNATALMEVLKYHVLPGNEFFGEGFENEGSFMTLQGDNVTITATTINENTKFASQNSLASNGVIHVIESVLLPPSLMLPTFTMTPVGTPTPAPSPSPTPAPVVAQTPAPATVAPVSKAASTDTLLTSLLVGGALSFLLAAL